MENQKRDIGRTCRRALLFLACLLAVFLFWYIQAKAGTVIRQGTVINLYSDSTLNVREGPGTQYARIGSVRNGDTGIIVDEGKDVSGTVWYKMNINGMSGWCSSDYVRVSVASIETDSEYEAQLAAQGFPESYWPLLEALHIQYPNWVFEAQITNLTWAEAVAGESTLARNLVSSGAKTSWKSTQNGAYDWQTGKWVVFDSGGWVAASSEIVQYYMDPRNFLDSTNIFQFIKQSYSSAALSDEQIAQTKQELTGMVNGTYLAGICPGTSLTYVDVIMSAAAESGVSPFTLASMMIQEQGINGQGNSISGRVPGYAGYYNYLNIGAYKTGNMTAVERGLWFAAGSGAGYTSYRRPWNNASDSIIGGADYYGEGYVKKGQDTLYLKKFNVQGSNKFGHQYMTNVQGAASEGIHMSKAYDDNARKSALIFKIPVYMNMPENACVQPSGDGNPNYMLQSLNVEGYSLTPSFNMFETSYSLIVPNEVTGITISAQAIAPTTNVAGTGSFALNEGSNEFNVTTTAQDGSRRIYTITIIREPAPQPELPPAPPVPDAPPAQGKLPTLYTSTYRRNDDYTITGITNLSTKVADFKKNLSVENGSIKITTLNGTEKSENSIVGTGDQVRVYDSDGIHRLTYYVVIYGDTSGDGAVDTLDLLRIQKRILEISSLVGSYGTAADTSKDGIVDALDLLQVQKQILNLKPISQ